MAAGRVEIDRIVDAQRYQVIVRTLLEQLGQKRKLLYAEIDAADSCSSWPTATCGCWSVCAKNRPGGTGPRKTAGKCK